VLTQATVTSLNADIASLNNANAISRQSSRSRIASYPHLEKALDQNIRLAKEGAAKELKICLANGNLDIARNRVGAPGSPKREAIFEDIFDINAHGVRT
jgi:hypothetical protein